MSSSICDAEQYNMRRKDEENESRMKEIELKLTDQTQLTAQLAAQLAAERLESEKKSGRWKKKWPKKIGWLKIIA
jgi:hypothetical protein